MTPYVYNLSMMLVWVLITGDLSLQNLTLGFLIGYGVLASGTRPRIGRSA